MNGLLALILKSEPMSEYLRKIERGKQLVFSIDANVVEVSKK